MLFYKGRGEVPNDSNFSWDFLYNKYPPGKRVCIAIFPYIGQHMRFWTYRILSHYTDCTNVPFNYMQKALIQMAVVILAEIVISLNKNTMFENLVNPDCLHKYFVGMCSDI